jgi:hypothetical protein
VKAVVLTDRLESRTLQGTSGEKQAQLVGDRRSASLIKALGDRAFDGMCAPKMLEL